MISVVVDVCSGSFSIILGAEDVRRLSYRQDSRGTLVHCCNISHRSIIL